MKSAIIIRLADAAMAVDEALHLLKPQTISEELRRELCNACDDYLAGTQLPRNKPSAYATPAQAKPKRAALGTRKRAPRRK